MNVMRVSESVYRVRSCNFYLRLCKTNNIQQTQGHHCGYCKGPAGSLPSTRHFREGEAIGTTDVNNLQCSVKTQRGSLQITLTLQQLASISQKTSATKDFPAVTLKLKTTPFNFSTSNTSNLRFNSSWSVCFCDAFKMKLPTAMFARKIAQIDFGLPYSGLTSHTRWNETCSDTATWWTQMKIPILFTNMKYKVTGAGLHWIGPTLTQAGLPEYSLVRCLMA